jgi:predicted transcriptional regulator
MGKMRIEPKVKQFDPALYEEIKQTLLTARDAAQDADIFWDLDKGEDANATKKNFQYVAEQESISLTIRRQRGKNSLTLKFADSERRGRIPASEARDRIVSVLKENGGPMKKGEILANTRLSQATWNLRIRELIDSGKVKRRGNRRDTTYTCA